MQIFIVIRSMPELGWDILGCETELEAAKEMAQAYTETAILWTSHRNKLTWKTPSLQFDIVQSEVK